MKEKYTGSYVQVSPSKIESRRDFRNIPTDTKLQRKSVFESYERRVPNYFTISEETKKAIVLLTNKNDFFSNIIKRKEPKYPDLRNNRKIVPEVKRFNPIEVESSLVEISSRSTNTLGKKEVGEQEEKKKGSSEKKVIFFEPLRKDLKKNYQ